jgi:hypothetical protein
MRTAAAAPPPPPHSTFSSALSASVSAADECTAKVRRAGLARTQAEEAQGASRLLPPQLPQHAK